MPKCHSRDWAVMCLISKYQYILLRSTSLSAVLVILIYQF